MELNSVQLLGTEYTSLALVLFLGYKCISLNSDRMNYYHRYLVSTIILSCINIPTRYVELGLVSWNRNFLYLVYAIDVISITFACAYWCMFLFRQLDSTIVNTGWKRHLFMTPAFLMVPLCIVNYWTGWLYYIDEASMYHRGSIFFLQTVIAYAYVAFYFICNIICIIAKKDGRGYFKYYLPFLQGIAFSVLQIMYGGSYLVYGIIFGVLITYIDICLDRQKALELAEEVNDISNELLHSNMEIASNMRTIIALSGIYDALYEIDLRNDVLNVIKAPDFIEKNMYQYMSADQFLSDLVNNAFTPEYSEMFGELYKIDNFNELFENRDSYSTDAQTTPPSRYVRTTIIVTQRDEDRNVTRFVLTLQDIDDIIEQQGKIEEAKKHEQSAKEMKELFEQTADALASAIDAKDKYTHGHSRRVADYSRRIAELAGFSEAECESVYYAGLLHDVGKIGIPDTIICKDGRLTDDEYYFVKQHPVFGHNILEKINKLPYLSIGANYHHERYDGTGYPAGLAGEGIPEMARIIAVADAYDAMTSNRSYRSPMAQQKVREEIVKGLGSQFDPEFGTIMLHIMDKDVEYKLKDEQDTFEIFHDAYEFSENAESFTGGIAIAEEITRVSFKYAAIDESAPCVPGIVVFDSLDGLVYTDESDRNKMDYTGFCDIYFDGNFNKYQIRDCRVRASAPLDYENIGKDEALIETVRHRDHMLITVKLADITHEYTIAMWDRSQYSYMAFTGNNCRIRKFDIIKDVNPADEDYIERIADEISYIEGKAEGNIKNIEIAGWREKSTDGVLITDSLDVKFHSMSLPAARRIWHCPFVVLYYSEDGTVNGPGYRELALIRLDGETWDEDPVALNNANVTFTDLFPGWEDWKRANREGVECSVHIVRGAGSITTRADNCGLHIDNVTTLTDYVPEIYFALTGDQVALTGINVKR